jgi:hypothetical protein
MDPTCDYHFIHRRRRLVELIIDPSSGQLSMSRLCLGLINVCGAIGGLYLAFNGNGSAAVGILAGIAASDAGVYFGSTRKRYRDGEGEQ